MTENELMKKLMVSKAIMDKSETIKLPGKPMLENFDIPVAKYNLPKEIVGQQENETKTTKQPTIEAIKNSKLPDEIKRLMIEHPISQPQQQGGSVLSHELVEKASRLMKNESTTKQETVPKIPQKKLEESTIDYNRIQKMIDESFNRIMKENGMILESFEKSNETFTFKVGKHIFEGKVTKIKKMS